MAVSEDGDHVGTESDESSVAHAARLASRWPYYRSKIFAERAALERNRSSRGNGTHEGDAFEVLCVNPSLLLGPGDLRGSSTEDIRLLLEGKVPAVPAGGLSFVDARDAAEAMVLAMEKGEPGARYLLGACNLTLRDFFERIARIAGVKAPWIPMIPSSSLAGAGARWLERVASRVGLPPPVDPVSVEMAQFFWYVDSSKAQRELGWRPRDPQTTLYETVEDLRTRGVVWPRDVS
jgi:dihydroflavonol-4-reductase